MKAINIILLGHDCGLIDNESNFTNYHTKDTLSISWKNKPQEQYNNWLNIIENQTIILKKFLKENNVNVMSINLFINFNLEGHSYSNKINKIN